MCLKVPQYDNQIFLLKKPADGKDNKTIHDYTQSKPNLSDLKMCMVTKSNWFDCQQFQSYKINVEFRNHRTPFL